MKFLMNLTHMADAQPQIFSYGQDSVNVVISCFRKFIVLQYSGSHIQVWWANQISLRFWILLPEKYTKWHQILYKIWVADIINWLIIKASTPP